MKYPVDYTTAYANAYLTADSDVADDECVDADGEVWPEHDFPPGAYECRRCEAEPDGPDGVYDGEIR